MSVTADLHVPGRLANRLRTLFFVTVVGAGMIVLASSLVDVIQHPPGFTWVVLLVMTCASGFAIVRLPGFPVSFSPSDALTIPAALLFGPAAGALCVAVDTLTSSMRLSRPHRTITTVLFNVTGPPVAMYLAADLFFRLGGARHLAVNGPTFATTVVPLAVFAGSYFILNTWLVATAVTAGRGGPLLRVWRDHFAPLWLTHFGGTSVAGLLLLSMQAGLFNLETLVVALPLLVVLAMAFSTGIGRVRRRSAEYDELRSYAAALRSTADAVLLTDAAGRVTLMNRMAERLTGWSHAEARGHPGAEIFQTVGPPLQALDSSLNAVAASVAEAVLVRRDGSTCPIEESHAYIREEDGTVSGTIRTFRDISPRKRLERERQALLEREKAARVAADIASRSKDEFLATLSHELRTPVMAIAGWIKLLKEGKVEGDQARKALASADRTVRAQAAVLDDLLDLSRIVRGTLKLAMRRTSVGDVLREACDTVDPARQAKHIALRVNVDPGLPLIEADPDRLRQVFWNVLSNAVKFTPAEGSIAASAVREGDTIRVDVTDTGVGITPDFLPFVFDRFRQADSSDTRTYQGLGLGLAIVRHLVEAHGGTASAASEGLDRGTRITIRLPISNSQRPTPNPQLARS